MWRRCVIVTLVITPRELEMQSLDFLTTLLECYASLRELSHRYLSDEEIISETRLRSLLLEDDVGFGDKQIDDLAKSLNSVKQSATQISTSLAEAMPKTSAAISSVIQKMPSDATLSGLAVRGDAANTQKAIANTMMSVSTATLTITAVTDTFVRMGKVLTRPFSQLSDDKKDTAISQLMTDKANQLPPEDDVRAGLELTVPSWASKLFAATDIAKNAQGAGFFKRLFAGVKDKIPIDRKTFTNEFLSMTPNQIIEISGKITPAIKQTQTTVPAVVSDVSAGVDAAVSEPGNQPDQAAQKGQTDKQSKQTSAQQASSGPRKGKDVIKSTDTAIKTWLSTLDKQSAAKAKPILKKMQSDVAGALQSSTAAVDSAIESISGMPQSSDLKTALRAIYPDIRESIDRSNAVVIDESYVFKTESEVRERWIKLAGLNAND